MKYQIQHTDANGTKTCLKYFDPPQDDHNPHQGGEKKFAECDSADVHQAFEKTEIQDLDAFKIQRGDGKYIRIHPSMNPSEGNSWVALSTWKHGGGDDQGTWRSLKVTCPDGQERHELRFADRYPFHHIEGHVDVDHCLSTPGNEFASACSCGSEQNIQLVPIEEGGAGGSGGGQSGGPSGESGSDNDDEESDGSNKKKGRFEFEWWVWLLISIGIAIVLVVIYLATSSSGGGPRW